jgi:hypothetical protein
MARNFELGKERALQSKARLSGKTVKKPTERAQANLLACLALLFIVSAATIPVGRLAHSRQEPNSAQSPASLQSTQPSHDFSFLGAKSALAALRSPRPPAVPPRPATPTGPPSAPVVNAPGNGSTGATTSPTLDVSVSDPASSNLSVTFYGKVANTIGPDFTIVALPDTQYYSSSLNGGTPAMFNAQTQWIVNNQKSLNIAYVAHLGDLVQNADNGGNATEWNVADGAFKILDNANIPYGVVPGNHDEGSTGADDGDASFTVLYNTYFGTSRFAGRSYYGGHYGTNNNNHYDLFSAGGMNFVAIYFAYDYNSAGTGLNTDFTSIVAWANGVLQQYSDRHAILVSHYIMGNGNPANLSIQGGAIVNGLGADKNVFLTLAGHYNTLPGEGQRASTVSGNTFQGLMSDYQDQPNGGNGWLRIMTFSPANSTISVQTYSPVLNQNMTDVASQFTVPWSAPTSGYTALGTVSNVASGAHATMNWSGLAPNTQYQWYAVVSNGTYTTTGPTWSFTTASSSGTPSASLSPTTLPFGSQLENSNSGSQTVTLSNPGTATLNILNIAATKDYSQTNTCGTSVTAGGNCSISVTFRPTVGGTDNGTLTVTDNASSGSQSVTLTGSGVAAAPVASLSKTSLSFGNQAVGTTSLAQSFTLTNTGNASLNINSVLASGDYSASTCASSLAPNGVCTISVTFKPTTTGTRTGAVTISDNAGGSPQTVTLTGTGTSTGTPAVSLSATSLTYGTIRVGRNSATKSVTLTNTGTAALSLTSIAASGDFRQTNTCGTSVSAGKNCKISVTFTPTATGTRTGAITITDNASGSPQKVSLTGTGR